ncbi:MAG: O-methyltransferase [Actinomycetota bacterium]
MAFGIVNPKVEDYMRGLLGRYDADAVLTQMEAEGRERGFPIVERQVGVTLETLARAIGARRVFELGSGYGYSAYWFARAAQEVHCTDGDPENEKKAMGYLSRAGLWDKIRYHVGDAVSELGKVDGEFDIVYNDIDKDGYPEAWKAARERVRVGGLYLCDNVLWSGRVAKKRVVEEGRMKGWTKAIRAHNTAIAQDESWISTIIPTRDGVMMALRLR